jgi:SAM-dependent methyltransferase
MPDPIFSNLQLAALYDALEGERRDLEFYMQLVDKFAARRVLDIGCGTGAFASFLASRGIEVIGLDPADASLTIARQRHEAKRVQWILGDTACLPPLNVDMATMTGNVAQVFLTDDEWLVALGAIGRALRPKGRLAFETRDPAKEDWRNWNRGQTNRRIEMAGMGAVRTWCDVTKVDGPFVSFRWTYEFEASGAVMVSDSTLRFRGQAEIVQSLEQAGYVVDEVLDASDRPGLELIFVVQRTE